MLQQDWSDLADMQVLSAIWVFIDSVILLVL